MLRVAAADDERHALERFEKLVNDIEGVETCGLFDDGKQLLEYLAKNPVDAVFLDIEMPEMSGLDLCEEVLNVQPDCAVVFITAFNQYAVEAFELNAVDYIMKPLTGKRLDVTMERILKRNRLESAHSKPKIQCFGSFEIFVDGRVLLWKNSKAKEILAFLVHKEGVPVSWDVITSSVWPDTDFEKAHANFHATMYLLRKFLSESGIPDILENARGNYRIRREKVSCDYYEVKQLSGTKKAETLANFEGGYMEENGYEWAYGRQADLERLSVVKNAY
jgi:Response regulator containing CheY-like receiver and SARP domains